MERVTCGTRRGRRGGFGVNGGRFFDVESLDDPAGNMGLTLGESRFRGDRVWTSRPADDDELGGVGCDGSDSAGDTTELHEVVKSAGDVTTLEGTVGSLFSVVAELCCDVKVSKFDGLISGQGTGPESETTARTGDEEETADETGGDNDVIEVAGVTAADDNDIKEVDVDDDVIGVNRATVSDVTDIEVWLCCLGFSETQLM